MSNFVPARTGLRRLLPAWGSLATNLMIAIAFVVTLISVVGAVAVWRADRASHTQGVTSQRYEAAAAIDRANTNWLISSSLTGAYLLFHDPSFPPTIEQIQQQTLADIDRATDLERQLGSDDQTGFLIGAREQIVFIQDWTIQLIEATNAGDSASAQQLASQIITQGSALEVLLTRLGDSERARVGVASKESASAANTFEWVLAVSIAAIVLLGIAAAFYVTRFVVRPLSHLSETARAFEGGNLDARAKTSGPQEVKELASVLNLMAVSIHERDSALRESEAYWHSLIENAQDIIVVVDAAGVVQYVSPAIKSTLGYAPAEVIGHRGDELVHPEDREIALAGIREARPLGGPPQAPLEFRMRKADGRWAHIEGRGTLVTNDDGNQIVVINARDISKRREAEDTIAHMAYHDSLTGLPNRLLLADRLNLAIAQARRSQTGLCVLSVDVDRFKNVNDLLGHGAGDELLTQVAARLRNLVRDGDTVSRPGGDEFVLVFPECQSLEQARETGERIVAGFRRPFRIAEREIHVTISAGAARFPDHGSDGESLISNADVALYAAKEAGRNTTRLYSEDLSRQNKQWFALEVQLRRALINNEIVVHYQPQVRVQTGEIIGAEALARWQHPERGLMGPDDFIPLAEETGLIHQLGEFVLRQACTDAMTWPDSLRVSVNVSLRQFERPDFVDRALAIVSDAGLPEQRLELEITESTALRNVERTREIATRLTDAGILLSIDDFGTGSTSLRHLQKLPLHQLKIDQSFMSKLGENPADAAIAASVISLGHKLNLTVIAEGVETQQQLDFLKEQNCDEFQGFLFSRAVPTEEFKVLASRPVLARFAE